MVKKEVSIVGAGTYGEVMYELAGILGYEIVAFYDEDDQKKGKVVMDAPVISKFSELKQADIQNQQFIVAIGNNTVRENIMNRINHFGGETPSLIHPAAVISPSAKIGKGVYIHANAYIWTKVTIKDYCIISPNVVIAHHSTLGKACLVSTLSGIGASIKIADRAFIGMGSTIVTGMEKIGPDTIIGAGAVVLKDVEKNAVFAGVPAKKIRDNN